MGLGYDSNPNLVSSGEEGSLVWKVQPGFYAGTTPAGGVQWYGFGSYSIKRAELEMQNVQLATNPAVNYVIETADSETAWLGGGFKRFHGERLTYGMSMVVINYADDIDDDNAYLVVNLTPGISYKVNDRHRLSSNLLIQRVDFKDRLISVGSPAKQSEDISGAEVSWWHRWQGNTASQLSLEYSRTSSNEESDNTSLKGAVIASWYQFSKHIGFNNIISYYVERFDSQTVNLNSQRQDKKLIIEVALSYQYTRNIDFEFSVKNSMKDSNNSSSEYNRVVTFWNVSFRY